MYTQSTKMLKNVLYICFIFGIVSAVRHNNIKERLQFQSLIRVVPDCECPKVSYPVPVCGVDGKNYFDECYAKCAGTTVAHEGYCFLN